MLMATWLNAVRDRFRRASIAARMRLRQRKRLGRLAGIEKLESRLYLAAVAWDGGSDVSHWSNPLNLSNNVLPISADAPPSTVGRHWCSAKLAGRPTPGSPKGLAPGTGFGPG